VEAAVSTSGPRSGGGRQRALAPLAVGGVLAAGAAYVGVVTPGEGRTIPCPFHAATGLWCPGCGMTRGVHRLLRADLFGALSFNVFVPLVVIGAVIGWWSWFAGRAWGRPVRWPATIVNRWWFGLGGTFVAYGVLRNISAFDVLAP
jgi:uncharacterized protein DUF2752